MESDWEVVCTAVSDVEAQLIKGLLEASGIKVVAVARGFGSLKAILGTWAGGKVELRVHRHQAEVARSIIGARVVDEEGDDGEETNSP